MQQNHWMYHCQLQHKIQILLSYSTSEKKGRVSIFHNVFQLRVAQDMPEKNHDLSKTYTLCLANQKLMKLFQ